MASTDLRLGDCLEILPHLQAQSVDMVLCDLPYGTTRCAWDVPIPLETLWAEYRRLLKPGGAVVLTAAQPFTSALVMSNLRWFKYEWIWEKGNAAGFLNAKKRPLSAHESVLVFAPGTPPYHPQMTQGHARKVTKRRTVDSACYGSAEKLTAYDSTERYPRSVQRFSSDKQVERLHPTQKPLELMKYLIATYTRPGAVVLDNAMGSGSTGVAAVVMRRDFVGVEKSPEIFRIAESRINAAKAKL